MLAWYYILITKRKMSAARELISIKKPYTYQRLNMMENLVKPFLSIS